MEETEVQYFITDSEEEDENDNDQTKVVKIEPKVQKSLISNDSNISSIKLTAKSAWNNFLTEKETGHYYRFPSKYSFCIKTIKM